MAESEPEISGSRIRLGVFLVLLWWLPFWLIQPVFVDLLNITSTQAKHQLLIAILVVQTIFGLAGIILGGKQIIRLARETPNRQILPRFWRTIRYGNN